MSVNRVFLIGNVGKVDVRSVGESKVASFSLATTERYKDRSGDQVENTTWHSIQVWGKTAEFVEKYITKGSQVYVEGRIQSRKYTDKDGVERTVTEIRADSVQNLTPKRDEPAQRQEEKREPSARRMQEADSYPDDNSPDLPF